MAHAQLSLRTHQNGCLTKSLPKIVCSSTVVKSPPRADFDGTAPSIKPKVLLVDDHPDILRSTSRLLSFDFDVVGTASDGLSAVAAAQRLDPDLIALDISMPGRDGFQTAQDLVQIGSRAGIVFLTMHESNDYVAEGFRSGGRGYVLKTRLHLDLANALQRVLAGQLFLPSLESLFAIDNNMTGHVVMFHDDDQSFVDGVSGFIGAALHRGDVVSLVTAAPDSRGRRGTAACIRLGCRRNRTVRVLPRGRRRRRVVVDHAERTCRCRSHARSCR